MFSSHFKKIVISLSIALAACGGFAIYYHRNVQQGPIYDFNPARDTQAMMEIFHQDWDWLLASRDSSPAFMLKHRTYDSDPTHFGSLHIKVLRENDTVAGFAAYYMETRTQGRLLFLAVSRNFRGHGYGKTLALRAIEELFKLGADHIALWTRVSNLPAQKIYRDLGFVEKFEENGYLFFEFWPQ
jgi:ribosomal protein S18 acetylase RimI-like enzyme